MIHMRAYGYEMYIEENVLKKLLELPEIVKYIEILDSDTDEPKFRLLK